MLARDKDADGSSDNNSSSPSTTVAMASPSTSTTTTTTTPPPLHEHSNAHLLKMDTGDKYSTVTALKRIIAKTAAASAAAATRAVTANDNNNNSNNDSNNHHALLPGLLRINKNPSAPYVYMAFATHADRQAAVQLLQTLQYRGRAWREVAVTAADLRVTHKGGKRARELHDNSNTTTATTTTTTTATTTSKVAAYACMPMAEQLRRKEQHCLDTLSRLLRSEAAATHGRVDAATLASQRFAGVVRSPQLCGYRNHVHLTFGHDVHGTPTLGFNAGAMIEGKTAIESVVDDDDGSDDGDDDHNDSSDTQAKRRHHDDDDGDTADGGRDGSGCDDSGSRRGRAAVVTMHPLARRVAVAVMGVCRAFLPRASSTTADNNNDNNDNNNNDDNDSDSVPLTVFDRVRGTGFWRRLQIRNNVRGEMMLDVELDTTGVSAQRLSCVLQRLVDACTSPSFTQRLRRTRCDVGGRNSSDADGGDGDDDDGSCRGCLDTAAVVSMQYHVHHGIGTSPSSPSSSPAVAHEGEAARVLFYGSRATLLEQLCGLSFEISPTSFFQVNTAATACLLSRVAEVADLQPTRTTLLDLCSGTGTIGLSLARRVRRVIGIEVVEAAVRNARANAERNGIANAVYHCGRVEHVLPRVLRDLHVAAANNNNNDNNSNNDDIVAIIDPPRAGVTSSVLQWLRGMAAIRRVVYISCEQRALERDCPHLCKPPTKAYRGLPFAITSAFAVDLFPHTPHVEMVVVLTRHARDDDNANNNDDNNNNDDDNNNNNDDEDNKNNNDKADVADAHDVTVTDRVVADE